MRSREVRHRLEHAVGVPDRECIGLGDHPEVEAERPGRGLVALARRLRELAEVERRGGDGERPTPEPCEVEQVADEPLEASGLALDHGAGPRRLEDAVANAFGVAPDRRQRGLELVAHREQERALRVLRPLELGGQVVERAREAGDLGRPFHGERRGTRAGAELGARVRDTRDRACNRAGEEPRDDRGERGADDARERQPDDERPPVGGLPIGGSKEDDRLRARRACGVEKALPAHLDRAACGQPGADALGACLGQEERGLHRRQDCEPLLIGGKESPQRRVGRRLGRVLPPGRDQLHLARERPDGGVLERAPREESARGDGDDERHDHGGADPEEQARAQAHRGTSL